MNTIQFKTRTYTILQTMPVGPGVASLGIVAQHVVEGARGATKLMQVFSNGHLRIIGRTGQPENWNPALAN